MRALARRGEECLTSKRVRMLKSQDCLWNSTVNGNGNGNKKNWWKYRVRITLIVKRERERERERFLEVIHTL